MIAKLHSTSRVVTINGQPCRVWEGTTAQGVPMLAFVVRVAAEAGYDLEEFEADLAETQPPSDAAARFPDAMRFEEDADL